MTDSAVRVLEAFLERDPDALDNLLRWLLAAPPTLVGDQRRTLRLELLLTTWKAHPRVGEIEDGFRAVTSARSMLRLMADAGMPEPTSILREATERITNRLVPRLHRDDDLYAVISRLNLWEEDARWVEALPPDILDTLAPLLAPSPDTCFMAVLMLALRASSVGLSRGLIDLMPDVLDPSSPLFRIAPTVRAIAAQPENPAMVAAWEECVKDLRALLVSAHACMEQRGVSTELLFRFDLLETQINRMQMLVAFARGREGGRVLAVQLIRSSVEQHGIGSLFRRVTKRLARKVVEHTADTGEHYLVNTRRDWDAVARKAAGGGFLTAFTALGKYALASLPLAPLVLGLGLAGNYAGWFVLMQLLHFTLASKQPAMTAAALAAGLDRHDGADTEVELVAGITRSQSIATLGNIAMTVPTSVLFALLFFRATGHPILGLETAEHTVTSLHPLRSFTLPFAALTGVFLWLASLSSGLAANWSAYRGFPEALARNHAIRSVLGKPRAQELGAFAEEHLGGIVGYVTLGFLLGFVPVVFERFEGIPLEVRHVTLSAASLALGVTSALQHGHLEPGQLIWALVGILAIAALNYGVSFGMAMRTAMRARDLTREDRRRLTRAIREAFWKSPKRFLWKPTT